MAKTYFNKNCVWMHLKSMEELEFLLNEIQKLHFKGALLFWEYEDDKKPENGIFVVIRRSIISKYLYGEEHTKWEKIKSHVYVYRRKHENAES